MAKRREQPHWRRNRPISLPWEDNARLERLKLEAEKFVTEPSYSLIVRAALKEFENLPDWKFRAAIKAIPPTRYGREPKEPRPTLSAEERAALLERHGLSRE